MIILFSVIGIIHCFHINKQGNFVDDDGTIRIFHGLNIVYKPPPYYPIMDHFDVMTSFSDLDCQLITSLGFNIIRLHVAFEAGMPNKGILNDEYILHIREIVRLAAKYDIYVILDAHQDLLNRQFCGEGFPDWAVTKFDFPSPQKIELNYDDQGYPLIEDCLKVGNFAKFYLTSDVGRNMESILKNENGVADMFGLFWKRVAEIHRDEWNVLGYEIMNEPSSGNYQKNKIQYLWPGWANNHLIMPFYQLINKYIREVDTQKLVFFEPYFTDAFGGGFKHNIGGKKYQKKEVLSYHLYCGIWKISPFLCKQVYNFMYPLKKLNMNHLKTGAMLTEFGSLPNEPFAQNILSFMLDKADNYLQSWAYWQYKGFNDYTSSSSMLDESIFNEDESLQKHKIQALVRPYAQSICASKIYYSKYNHKKQKFSLKYNPIPNCKTIIYIPSINEFTVGFRFTCKSKIICSLSQADDYTWSVENFSGRVKLTIQPSLLSKSKQ
ncbi:unnamed protein product [Paramecium primaurelia]|uniref:Glycoside hydrolase family 5 domain-containing protein n=1 Tax=Paramecium primaurelia TaxID=5886 RepID=A0A8S1PEY3_PARPR|nr:unnamed protein product [Paramecium primaurelia]